MCLVQEFPFPRRSYLRLRLVTSLTAAGLLAGCLPTAASARSAPSTSWASNSIATILAHGLVPGVSTQAQFRPSAALDGTTLNAFAANLFPSRRLAANVQGVNPAPQKIGALDKKFVMSAGLTGAVARAIRGVRASGYPTISGAGMEAAARMLQLRYDFPASEDNLERSSREIARRADAAYSAAVVLDWGGWEVGSAKTTLAMLGRIPATTGERHAIITRAFSKLGMPYIWGGESDTAESSSYAFGSQAHGGYDCSGFVWRVVALDPASPSGALARIGGRTTFDMARTTPRSKRLSYSQLQPGDLMLFGDSGVRSTYSQVGHVGIYLGNNLMIHSSSQGVMISEVDTGWYEQRFAFGKSVVPPDGVTGRRLASVGHGPITVPADISDATAGQDNTAPAR